MNRLFLVLSAVLTSTCVVTAAWKPDKNGPGESFEDKIPSYFTVENSKLTVSAKRYKYGKKSLCWSTGPGSVLRIASPALKATAAAKAAGVMLWYYNEKPQSGKLTVNLFAKGVKVYSFPLGLSFKGWRAAWVCFSGDLKPLKPGLKLKGDVVMTVTAPQGGAGEIYFDAIRFTAKSSWRRSRDFQVPFVKASTGTHWQASYNASQVKVPPATEPVTAEHKAAFALMTKRYEDWALGRTLKPGDPLTEPMKKAMQDHIKRGKAYYKKLGIKCVNGVYTGQPFFAGRSSLTPNFCSELFQNAPVALALDYRVNGNRQSARDYVTLINFANDQGWANGSAIGTLDHEMLRAAGYMHSVFLMRDVLREAGILKRELATMRWHCFMNMIYEKPKHTGTNADRMRTIMLFMVLNVLAMDDSPEKLRDMKCLLRWQNNACRVAPGWADTIKPDFTGFHHAGVYANAYSPGALHIASFAAYLQHNTPFAFDEVSLSNLKQALFTARIMSNLYDPPTPISGRMPFSEGTWLRYAHAFAYLAIAKADDEVAAAFKRLWLRASNEQQLSVLQRQGVSISWYSPAGLQSIIRQALARPVVPEATPTGNWSKPYGALSVQRRGEWMALVKGYGQYVWDVEKHFNQNIYGLFISYGSISIFGAGNPVSAKASGFSMNGWDWRLWPGTTAPYIPWEQFEKYEDVRRFSSSRMAGGVSNGRDGVFGLDLRADGYGFKLNAKKTVFMKDNLLVCLGSDISASGTKALIRTCLFQAALSKPIAPRDRNGAFTIFSQERHDDPRTLTDSVGNRYVIPAGQKLYHRRSVQESRHERKKTKTWGSFDTAWLEHGVNPSGASYQYAVQIQAKGEAAPRYTVLQRNGAAHVVRFPDSYTGYCIFDPAKPLPAGDLAVVDKPCLVMTERVGEKLKLTVANPDLNFDLDKLPSGLREVRENIRYQPSRPAPVRVTLNGVWMVAGAGARVVPGLAGKTVVEFACIDGRSIGVVLSR